MNADSWRPQLTESIAAAFDRAGLELYLVGGAVRDGLLGRAHDDLDFATNAPPGRSADILSSIRDQSVYRVGEKFGTIGVAFEGHTAEITTYRSAERYPEGSRKPEVDFGRTIEEDLSRRDFTINAMARQAMPDESPLVDPFGGRDDLEARLVRAVGNADERFAEDPLRIMRGVRFAAGLGFQIEPTTWEGMCRTSSLLERISRERVADELTQMLVGPAPGNAFGLLRDSGALAHTVPELMGLNAIPDQGPYHHYSLWEHTFR